ncbi:hypothetical protein EW145_g4839 [Phellinidium pouzarii]|uniref:Uncharacterized protein n=1 Tax=Phellinidium pouzarii TaxID=167371 RepID=A0A4S4L229_9AGAM|nr:hypothetical protein EW145_g4839 [Phellinidium pouzarii]
MPEAAQRIVPGAPPVASSLTKTQKKKRRSVKKDDDEPVMPQAAHIEIPDVHSAALTDKAPRETDVKGGSVAEELVAQPESAKEESEDPFAIKPSPVVDLLNKRLKALGKKITRIHTYSDKPTAELNDDQKKTLATLPSLEAVRKELEETRKAVEVLEAENAIEAARRKAEAEVVEKQRVADTLATAQKAHATRTAQVLDFIRLHKLVINSHSPAKTLSEAEINAINHSAHALLLPDGDYRAQSKHDVLSGFLSGEGDVEGVSYIRLLELADTLSNPEVNSNKSVSEETPTETEEATQAESVSADAEASTIEPEAVISGVISSASGTSGVSGAMSFRFMQESELDSDPVSFENGAEWVEKDEVVQVPTELEPSEDVNETYNVSKVVETQIHVAPANINGALDWADDEGGLPSIDGLHASFGTSGSATPTPEPAPEAPQHALASSTPTAQSVPAVNNIPNGHPQPIIDDDGFIQARGVENEVLSVVLEAVAEMVVADDLIRVVRAVTGEAVQMANIGAVDEVVGEDSIMIVVAHVVVEGQRREISQWRKHDDYVLNCCTAKILWDEHWQRSGSYFGGGTFTLTSASGATATFAFNGTGVWLYGAKRSNHGLYSVALDGNKQNFSGNVPVGDDEFQVPLFSASGLTLGAHTLVLENEGTSPSEMFLDVDFIRWETQLGQDNYTLNQTLTQATSSSLSFQFSGFGWESSGVPTEAGLSTDEPGDYATLAFEGKENPVMKFLGPSCGLFGVQVDDGAINTYNASRPENATDQLIYYGSNLGSGQHILQVTNMQTPTGGSTTQTLVISQAEVIAASAPSSSSSSHENNTVSATSSSKSNKSALIGGLCGSLIFLGLLVLGLWLWLRKRRFRHTAKNVSPLYLKTFDIDDDVPLHAGSWSSRTSTPDAGRNSATSHGSYTAHNNISNITSGKKPHVLTFDRSSGRSSPSGQLSGKNPSSSQLPYDGRSSKGASNSRLSYDRQSNKNVSSSKLPYDSPGKISRGKLPHHSSSNKHGKSRAHAPRNSSRKRGKPAHRQKKKYSNDFTVDVLRLGPHPLPPIPKPGEKGITPKGRRRSIRNSRILRAGYNIFFAKPGSSNSGSAYEPSTVLTSEISERPTATLSPVREAPPPLPASRPQTPQRSLQIVNLGDE